MTKKRSGYLPAQETIDVESAIKMLIDRLQKAKQEEGESAEEIQQSVSSLLVHLGQSPETAPPSVKQTEPQAKPPPKAAPTPKPKAAPAPPPPGEVIRQPRQPVNTTNTDAIVTLMPQTGMDSIPVDYLTVSYFRKVLLPYLNAIAGAQKIIEKTQDKILREITVQEAHQHPRLTIHLKGAAEALRLIHELVTPWRQENAESLRQSRQATFSREKISRAKTQLTLKMLASVNPHLSPAKNATFSIELQPHVDVLLFSELLIVNIEFVT